MNHPKATTLLWLLSCAVLLTACANPQTQKEIIQVPCPAPALELFEPVLEPFKPGPGATQKTVALLIEDFREKLGMCNADKQTIRLILNP